MICLTRKVPQQCMNSTTILKSEYFSFSLDNNSTQRIMALNQLDKTYEKKKIPHTGDTESLGGCG